MSKKERLNMKLQNLNVFPSEFSVVNMHFP